jgi:hypothetical protein
VEKNCNPLDIKETPFGHSPYYGSYVQQSCNRLESRATLFGRGLNTETHGVRYGKPVAQKTVQTLIASVRTPAREFRDRLILGLLSL